MTVVHADVGKLPDAIIDIWGKNNLEELAGETGVTSVLNVNYPSPKGNGLLRA